MSAPLVYPAPASYRQIEVVEVGKTRLYQEEAVDSAASPSPATCLYEPRYQLFLSMAEGSFAYGLGVPLKLAHSVLFDPLPHEAGPCSS